MTEDKDRKIQDLEKAIKVQANAFRTFIAGEGRELNILRKQEFEATHALRQLDSEREVNAILTDEVEQLEIRLGTEAANERAKTLTFLRGEAQIMAAGIQAQNMLLEAAAKIEAGEHLK